MSSWEYDLQDRDGPSPPPISNCSDDEEEAEDLSVAPSDPPSPGQEGEDRRADVEDLVSLFGSRSTIVSEALRRRRLRHEGRTSTPPEGVNDTVLSVVWIGGRLGAAYYHVDSGEVFVLPDIAETAPDFYVFRSLMRQVAPRFLIMSSSMDQRFVNVAREICGEKLTGDPDESRPSTVQQVAEETASGTQMIQLAPKMFYIEHCKVRLMATRLPSMPQNCSDHEKELYISALIPVHHEKMVRAAGAVLQYLDKRGLELFQIEPMDGQIPVLDIQPCTMEEIVMIDDTAWKSLQIFSTDNHPSSVKQMKRSGAKEGISIYGILSKNCCSAQGGRALKQMLLRPSRSRTVLKRRHDVISYCCNSRNFEFVKATMDCLKAMKGLPKLLYKLTLLHATVQEWKDLYQTIYHGVLVCEMCSAQSHNISLFSELSEPELLLTLRAVQAEMRRVIDFEESVKADRIVPRPGLDPNIDQKKKQYGCLPDIMALVAREEMDSLPGYIQRCSVVYIPEVGYLLDILLWRADLTIDEMEIEGFEFKFKTAESAYYKTPRTKELDSILGDCSIAILQLETGVMIYLTEEILKFSKILLRASALTAELDSLMSMAALAKSCNFVRPQIVADNEKIEIEEGRHPLVEALCDYVPSSTRLSEEEKIVIITGPNASGKSVYLKQVGVISIMALAGSFVPAAAAKIPTFDRISTRIHSTESISSGFSTFMVDLNQMSAALRYSTRCSLVIIDEFGKGTAEADGLSLLVASLNDFAEKDEDCPTVLVSTHFYSAASYLKHSPLFKFQTMKFIEGVDGDEGSITYLYELVNGACHSSLAHMVAEKVGIPRKILDRTEWIAKIVSNQVEDRYLRRIVTHQEEDHHGMVASIGNHVANMRVEDMNMPLLWEVLNSTREAKDSNPDPEDANADVDPNTDLNTNSKTPNRSD